MDSHEVVNFAPLLIGQFRPTHWPSAGCLSFHVVTTALLLHVTSCLPKFILNSCVVSFICSFVGQTSLTYRIVRLHFFPVGSVFESRSNLPKMSKLKDSLKTDLVCVAPLVNISISFVHVCRAASLPIHILQILCCHYQDSK
jgi:hypothetical protein